MADSLRAPAHRVEPRPSALAALTVNGANRFRRYSFAPTHATWGLPHRTTRIRVKAIRDEAPPLANCIGGGASKSPSVKDGLRGGGEGWPETPPGTAGPGGPDRLLEGRVDGPTRLDEAVEALAPDAVLHAALGPALVNSVVAVKRYELNQAKAALFDSGTSEFSQRVEKGEHQESFEFLINGGDGFGVDA